MVHVEFELIESISISELAFKDVDFKTQVKSGFAGFAIVFVSLSLMEKANPYVMSRYYAWTESFR